MEFTLKETFQASAKKLYNTWLTSDGHTKMTGGEATISSEIGKSYSAWDGYISGKNITLEENKRIIQSWRSTQFEENEQDSQIELVLAEDNGTTELTLIHTNVPESGEHYKKGWEEHYFQPMKVFFENK